MSCAGRHLRERARAATATRARPPAPQPLSHTQTVARAIFPACTSLPRRATAARQLAPAGARARPLLRFGLSIVLLRAAENTWGSELTKATFVPGDSFRKPPFAGGRVGKNIVRRNISSTAPIAMNCESD